MRFRKIEALGVRAALDDDPLDTRPLLEAIIPTTTKTIHIEKKKKKIAHK